jgi:hypothetical protein
MSFVMVNVWPMLWPIFGFIKLYTIDSDVVRLCIVRAQNRCWGIDA